MRFGFCIDNFSDIEIQTWSQAIKENTSPSTSPNVENCIIGRPIFSSQLPLLDNSNRKQVYIGKNCHKLSSILKLQYPIKNGIITNMGDMDEILRYIFIEELKCDPSKHPLLISIKGDSGGDNRKPLLELLFNRFNIPVISILGQFVLIRTQLSVKNGIIISIGDSSTEILPFISELEITASRKRIPIGGSHITTFLKDQLKSYTSGIDLDAQSGKNMVKQIKELHAEISFGDTPLNDDDKMQHYITSDEQEISFPSNLLTKCCEVLFNPALMGLDSTLSLQSQLLTTINSYPENIRSQLSQNIILCGGTAQLPGLSERLIKELKDINIIFPKDEDQHSQAGNLAWMGGAKISLNNTCQWFRKKS